MFAGLAAGSGTVRLDTNLIHYRELAVVGAAGASPAQNARALELIGTGQVTVADLITHRLRLTEIHAALDVLRRGAAIKVTVEP